MTDLPSFRVRKIDVRLKEFNLLITDDMVKDFFIRQMCIGMCSSFK